MVLTELADPLICFSGAPLFRTRRFRARGCRNICGFLRCSLILLSLPCTVFALAPSQPLAQMYHTSWTAKQGVTGNVTALAQSTDGYLWVGTTEGLLRFDGISFERYQPEEGSLIATSVSALMAVPDGGLWVGFTRGGASFIQDGRVTSYSDADGFPVSTVRSFAHDRSGAIWAAAVGGFARLEGQRWQKNYSDWSFPSLTAWALLVDREGTLWVASGSQIVYLRTGEKRFRTTGIRASRVSDILQAPDGSIWFNDDLRAKFVGFRLAEGKAIELLPEVDLPSNSAIFDHNGALWSGDEGLNRFPVFGDRAGRRSIQAAEKFTAADGLSATSVQKVIEDREGNIWVGTVAGLDRFRYRNVTWFALNGGPFSLMTGPDGKIWAGSRGMANPLIRVEDRMTIAGGPIDVFTAYRDADGSEWISGNHRLLHWLQGRFDEVPVPEEVVKMSLRATPPDPIIASAITRDGAGDLWVAFGGSGEFRLKDGAWTFVQVLQDHPDWSACYAFTDHAGRVWLLWGDRAAESDHGNVKVFDAQEGLSIGPPDVIAERDQTVWIGGESGLAFLQDGRFHTLQKAEGAGFTSVTGIVATKDDGLWLSVGAGVVHIPESEIDALTQHPEHRVTFQLFDLVTDLPEQIQRGEVYASGAIQASDGKIWFATRSGAVRVDPAHIYKNALPPPVSIRSIVADDKTFSTFTSPHLPALTKNLRIGYTALSLSIPERIRFRYKLQGWSNDWQEADGRREAIFTNLAPGEYSFRVIACNSDGVWNDEGAVLTFTVAHAWFQTTWFRAFCVALSLLLLWALYLLRLRQLHHQFSVAMEARIDERTRIARDLHDTLLQSFNALLLRLQTVSNVLPARPDEAKRRVEEAIEQGSNAITEGRDTVHALRSSGSAGMDLDRAISNFAKELLSGVTSEPAPELHVQVEGKPTHLNPIVRDEVYRIATEAVRNAIRHANARRIEVEIRYDEQHLRLRIGDNGAGIDPAILNRDHKAGHWGLRGMRERAKLVGGTLEVWSQINVGTEIDLSIPAASVYAKPNSARWSVLSHFRRN
jgi:signal transduction histidine kinase/ligand-binding sensor domain-containing protein